MIRQKYDYVKDVEHLYKWFAILADVKDIEYLHDEFAIPYGRPRGVMGSVVKSDEHSVMKALLDVFTFHDGLQPKQRILKASTVKAARCVEKIISIRCTEHLAEGKEPSAKQPRLEKEKKAAGWLQSLVKQQREDKKDTKFNKKRQRFLTDTEKIRQGSEGVLYWMLRDQRVQDNWALIRAQQLAAKEELPLHVCFCLVVPKSEVSTLRHYAFLLKGLEEVAKDCKRLNIQFHLLHGAPGAVLPGFVSDQGFGAMVTDFSPLRESQQWLNDVKKKLSEDIPFVQ
ncbi:hypothetical protein AMECASPLE_028306, partial [Ameca splendens]